MKTSFPFFSLFYLFLSFQKKNCYTKEVAFAAAERRRCYCTQTKTKEWSRNLISKKNGGCRKGFLFQEKGGKNVGNNFHRLSHLCLYFNSLAVRVGLLDFHRPLDEPVEAKPDAELRGQLAAACFLVFFLRTKGKFFLLFFYGRSKFIIARKKRLKHQEPASYRRPSPGTARRTRRA